jgi:hypothetical protein
MMNPSFSGEISFWLMVEEVLVEDVLVGVAIQVVVVDQVQVRYLAWEEGVVVLEM